MDRAARDANLQALRPAHQQARRDYEGLDRQVRVLEAANRREDAQKRAAEEAARLEEAERTPHPVIGDNEFCLQVTMFPVVVCGGALFLIMMLALFIRDGDILDAALLWILVIASVASVIGIASILVLYNACLKWRDSNGRWHWAFRGCRQPPDALPLPDL